MKAYPFIHKDPTSGLTRMEEGMDLRDYFAGLALQGLIASIERYIDPEEASKHAYRYADFMMKQRKDVPNE